MITLTLGYGTYTQYLTICQLVARYEGYCDEPTRNEAGNLVIAIHVPPVALDELAGIE
jgi:hypothetical protein